MCVYIGFEWYSMFAFRSFFLACGRILRRRYAFGLDARLQIATRCTPSTFSLWCIFDCSGIQYGQRQS